MATKIWHVNDFIYRQKVWVAKRLLKFADTGPEAREVEDMLGRIEGRVWFINVNGLARGA